MTTKTSFKDLVKISGKYTVKNPPPVRISGPVSVSVGNMEILQGTKKKYSRGGGIRKPKW